MVSRFGLEELIDCRRLLVWPLKLQHILKWMSSVSFLNKVERISSSSSSSSNSRKKEGTTQKQKHSSKRQEQKVHLVSLLRLHIQNHAPLHKVIHAVCISIICRFELHAYSFYKTTFIDVFQLYTIIDYIFFLFSSLFLMFECVSVWMCWVLCVFCVIVVVFFSCFRSSSICIPYIFRMFRHASSCVT